MLHTLAHRDLRAVPTRPSWARPRVFSGLLGGCLFSLLFVWVLFTDQQPRRRSLGPAVATFGPPLALLVVVVAFLAEVAVLGRTIGEAEREWWARLSAWLLMAAVAWSTFFGCLLFVPALLIWFNDRYVNTGIVAGWIATTVGGLMAGRSRADQGRQRHSMARVAGRHRPACVPRRPVYRGLAAGRLPGERSRSPASAALPVDEALWKPTGSGLANARRVYSVLVDGWQLRFSPG